MIRIDFPEQDLRRIKQLRYDHPHPRVRKRMDVLWLKSQGLPHEAICRLTDICGNTLREYLRRYQSGGLESVMELNFYAPTSELERHRDRLETHFREHPPATIKEAMAKIQELTEIKRSPSAVGRFLNSLGMAPRKVGSIPSKADPDAQAAFRVNELEPRLEEAKEGKRAIFLSTLPTSSSDLSSGFFGPLPDSLSRLPPGADALTFSAH
jgi:transposase